MTSQPWYNVGQNDIFPEYFLFFRVTVEYVRHLIVFIVIFMRSIFGRILSGRFDRVRIKIFLLVVVSIGLNDRVN
jgi:isocitrate dehydrogenase kinase/phosphatase